MTKHNQKGFSIIEGLLIVVVALMIGGTGYYVWQGNKKTGDILDKTAQSDNPYVKQKPKTTPSKDEAESWLLYQAPSGNYKLRLPDGWSLQRYQKGDSIYATSADSIMFKSGTAAVVNEVDGGRDFANISFMLNYGDSTNHTTRPEAVKQKTIKTKQGLSVTRYYFKQQNEPQAIDISLGTEQYTYVLVKDDKTLHVIHDVAPGGTNQAALVEKALVTLEIR